MSSEIESNRAFSERLNKRFKNIQKSYQDFGLPRAIYRAVMNQLHELGFHLFRVQLGDDSLEIAEPELEPGYTVQMLSPEDLLKWVSEDNFLSEEFLREAAHHGDRCVANFFDDELVGYGFVTQTRARVTEQIDVVVDERLVYRYKGWTHPEHRRKKLSFARGRLNKHLFPLTDGRRTVSYVDTHNFASKLHSKKIHPISIGHCGYFEILGREYPFTFRTPRRFGFRLERRNERSPD